MPMTRTRMDAETILQHFEHPTEFPEAAVRAAIADKEAVIPHLLTVLVQVVSGPDKALEDERYMAHLFAMFLLAQFREPRAYPLLVRLGRLPSRTLHSLAGDVVTEDFDAMLASVCGTEFAPLRALVEDPEVDEYVRSAALRALTKVYFDGRLSRQCLVDYHRHLLHGGLKRTPDFIWSALIVAAIDIHPGENMAALQKVYRDGLVDPLFVGRDNLEQAAARSVDELEAERRRSHGRLIDDTISCMKCWPCFARSRSRRHTTASSPTRRRTQRRR
jgi:hypothetical protein